MLYIIKSFLCLSLFYIAYKLLLEREKMPVFNRFYLLASLLLGHLIPLFKIELGINLIDWPIIQAPVEATNAGFFIPSHLIGTIYWVGLMIGVIRFYKNYRHLIQLAKSNPLIKYHGTTLVLVESLNEPFTFLQKIFINQNQFQSGNLDEAILKHELAHAKQWHTLDILLINTLKTFFWFNPLLLLYKRSIQLNHEFLADAEVLNQLKDVTAYQNLLLNHIVAKGQTQFSSGFFMGSTKKRFLMMVKGASAKRILLNKMVVIPFFFLIFMVFGTKVNGQTLHLDPNENTTFNQTSKQNFTKRTFSPLPLILPSKKHTSNNKWSIPERKQLDSIWINSEKHVLDTFSIIWVK